VLGFVIITVKTEFVCDYRTSKLSAVYTKYDHFCQEVSVAVY